MCDKCYRHYLLTFYYFPNGIGMI